MPGPKDESCATCYFFAERNDDDEIGICKRHAPAPVFDRFFEEIIQRMQREDESTFFEAQNTDTWATWPTVTFEEWCGEFKRLSSA